jgi:hypothetical protein
MRFAAKAILLTLFASIGSSAVEARKDPIGYYLNSVAIKCKHKFYPPIDLYGTGSSTATFRVNELGKISNLRVYGPNYKGTDLPDSFAAGCLKRAIEKAAPFPPPPILNAPVDLQIKFDMTRIKGFAVTATTKLPEGIELSSYKPVK